jgi:hypothetical protein
MTDDAWWRNPAAFPPGWKGTTSPEPATPSPALPEPAPASDLPPRVIRTRQQLEELREDAIASQPIDDPLRVQIYPECSPAGLPSALEGIIDTTRWLLGERLYAPISLEAEPYPDLSLGKVWTAAEDCIFEYAWHDVSEWYAGGVQRTITWARSDEESRPLSGPPLPPW